MFPLPAPSDHQQLFVVPAGQFLIFVGSRKGAQGKFPEGGRITLFFFLLGIFLAFFPLSNVGLNANAMLACLGYYT